MRTFNAQHVNTVIPFPCRCTQCCLIKGPAMRVYNCLEYSIQTVCLECYANLSGSGVFDTLGQVTHMQGGA